MRVCVCALCESVCGGERGRWEKERERDNHPNNPMLPCRYHLPLSPDLPSHKEIRLPALSPTMSTGTIVAWEKEEGEEIADGDVLAQVETDKATMDMDSTMSGYMAKIVIPAGTKDIPLGKVRMCPYGVW